MCSALRVPISGIEIWKSESSLKELVSEDKFKSFDELKTKLDRVLGLGSEFSPTPKSVDVPFDGGKAFTPAEAVASSVTAESESTEEYAYFSKLAEGN